MRSGAGLVAVSLLTLFMSDPASATLGGNLASVQSDQTRMGASMQSARVGNYTIYELQLPSGCVVKEYVSSTNVVFAVAWQGPSLPDLQQVLGTFFDQYTEAVNAERRGPGARSIQEPGLVVQSGGHMRAFFGRAYVPQMLPQDVSADEIR